jgi:hypothetical protein
VRLFTRWRRRSPALVLARPQAVPALRVINVIPRRCITFTRIVTSVTLDGERVENRMRKLALETLGQEQ